MKRKSSLQGNIHSQPWKKYKTKQSTQSFQAEIELASSTQRVVFYYIFLPEIVQQCRNSRAEETSIAKYDY